MSSPSLVGGIMGGTSSLPRGVRISDLNSPAVFNPMLTCMTRYTKTIANTYLICLVIMNSCLSLDAFSWIIYLFINDLYGFSGFMLQILTLLLQILVPFIVFGYILWISIGGEDPIENITRNGEGDHQNTSLQNGNVVSAESQNNRSSQESPLENGIFQWTKKIFSKGDGSASNPSTATTTPSTTFSSSSGNLTANANLTPVDFEHGGNQISGNNGSLNGSASGSESNGNKSGLNPFSNPSISNPNISNTNTSNQPSSQNMNDPSNNTNLARENTATSNLSRENTTTSTNTASSASSGYQRNAPTLYFPPWFRNCWSNVKNLLKYRGLDDRGQVVIGQGVWIWKPRAVMFCVFNVYYFLLGLQWKGWFMLFDYENYQLWYVTWIFESVLYVMLNILVLILHHIESHSTHAEGSVNARRDRSWHASVLDVVTSGTQETANIYPKIMSNPLQ